MTPHNLPTLPPGPSDADALEFARRLAAEPDTGPLALPGSARFDRLARMAQPLHSQSVQYVPVRK